MEWAVCIRGRWWWGNEGSGSRSAEKEVNACLPSGEAMDSPPNGKKVIRKCCSKHMIKVK